MDKREVEAKYQEILKKLEREDVKLDISREEDLSFAVMNLISIEEHLFMSGTKTGNKKYFELLNEVREIRKKLMGMLIREIEEGSETWCVLKHLLAATMRLNEVGTKLNSSGEKEKAIEMFNKAYTLYTLFWSLNLGIFNLEKIKEEIEKDKDILQAVKESEKIEKETKEEEKENKTEEKISEKLKRGLKRLISCCIE